MPASHPPGSSDNEPSSIDQNMAQWYAQFQSESLDPEMTLSEFAVALREMLPRADKSQGATATPLRRLAAQDPERLVGTNSDPSHRRQTTVADKLADFTQWLEDGIPLSG